MTANIRLVPGLRDAALWWKFALMRQKTTKDTHLMKHYTRYTRDFTQVISLIETAQVMKLERKADQVCTWHNKRDMVKHIAAVNAEHPGAVEQVQA